MSKSGLTFQAMIFIHINSKKGGATSNTGNSGQGDSLKRVETHRKGLPTEDVVTKQITYKPFSQTRRELQKRWAPGCRGRGLSKGLRSERRRKTQHINKKKNAVSPADRKENQILEKIIPRDRQKKPVRGKQRKRQP